MKLYATLKNERGGKKSTGDDTRILVELSYKNKIVGTVGLYSVWDKDEDLGYRVVWQDETGYKVDNVIREEVRQTQKDEIKDYGKKICEPWHTKPLNGEVCEDCKRNYPF